MRKLSRVKRRGGKAIEGRGQGVRRNRGKVAQFPPLHRLSKIRRAGDRRGAAPAEEAHFSNRALIDDSREL